MFRSHLFAASRSPSPEIGPADEDNDAPQPQDDPPVMRDPNLRPGQEGWTWPNPFSKASMAGRHKSVADLLGVKTVENLVYEAAWEPGYGQGVCSSISEHLLRFSI